MEKVFIPSSVGKLAAVIHNSGSDNLAVLCPGFLDSKDYAGLVSLAEELTKVGYTVVRFDPTGTWESEGDISYYNNTQYLKDIKAVLAYMYKETQYKKLLLAGHSRGGTMALFAAAQEPRVTQVLSIMGSPVNRRSGDKLVSWEKQGSRLISRDDPFTSNVRDFTVPFSHIVDKTKYDGNFAELKRIKVPKLIVAAGADEVVPLENMQKLFTELTEPKKFVLIPGVGHDYRHNPEDIKVVNRYILENLN